MRLAGAGIIDRNLYWLLCVEREKEYGEAKRQHRCGNHSVHEIPGGGRRQA
jgi:hypothetical protein